MKNLTKKQKITYVVITIIILAIIGTIIGVVTHKAKKPELIECKETEQQIKEEEVTNELPKDYKGEVDIVEEEIEVKGKDGKVEKKVVRKAVPKGQGKGKVVGTTNTNKMNTTKPNTNNTTNKPTQKPTQKPNTPNTTKPNTTKPKPVYKAFEIRDNDKRILWVENGNGGKVVKIGFKDGTEYEVLSTRKEYDYWVDIITKPVVHNADGTYNTKRFSGFKSYEEMNAFMETKENTEKYDEPSGWGFDYIYYYTIRQIAK